MNRSMFLKRLRLELYGLPEQEIESIVQSYDDFFKEAAENHMTEEATVEELGNPKEIAEDILKRLNRQRELATKHLVQVASKCSLLSDSSYLMYVSWLALSGVYLGFCSE